MIPYFSWQTILLGPVTLQVWGICVASGAFLALFFCLREIKRAGLNSDLMWQVFFWLFLGGFIGARIFHVVFYEWSYYLVNPFEIIKFWHGGASSLGGFAGALTGLLLFLKTKKLSFVDFKPYTQIIGVWFWLGWAIGRIGCFLIHDHPGRLTDFFLAVNFPTGARYDLGLMDSLLAFAIFGILLFVRRRRADKVNFPILGFSIYAFVRFFLDFLRAEDVSIADARYLYLTPAQWGIIGFFAVLLIMMIIKKRKTSS
jgi:phosphatidylglycerol:prolipoprotein diacylglycerol transferase